MNKSLREIAEVHYGNSPNGVRADDSSFPIFGTGGQMGWASRPLFDGPLVVVARKGTLGNPTFCLSPCWVIDTAYAVIARNEVDTKWLFYNLLNFNLESLNEATGVPSISRDYLYRIAFETPLLPEQRKIARILTTLDNLIEKTESLIAKYQAIKQGMMHDLFTRGVDAHGHLRPTQAEAPDLYKPSELGWIPKEWAISRVGDHLDRIEQGWSPDCDSEPASAGEWGVLKTTSVVWQGFNCQENKRLPSFLGALPQYEVHTDDVLMTRGGPNSRVGVVAIVRKTRNMLMLSDKIYRLVPKKSVLPRYLSLALSSESTQTYLSTLKTGLAESQTNISQEIVRRLWIGIPDHAEQQRTCARIDAIENFLCIQRRSLDEFRVQKVGLMQDLLTGKVRVRVDEAEEVAAHV